MTLPFILRHRLAALLLIGAAVAATAANAQDDVGDMPAGAEEADASPGKSAALLDMPLEDLLTMETTSVAKKRQEVRDSAAAVYVITQDDIRRSAASNIPDLLRMVPGVEVAQVNTGGVAVSIRGFNNRLANSVLVMIDGRSIFVSTLSGVFWDQLLLPLSDIERIEVVRGPGATLWGSNAANGVINIITRHSSDSLGLTAVARASTRSQEASLSYAGRSTDDLSYRIYGDIRREDGTVDAQGNNQSTHWNGQSLGARVDWEPGTNDAFTFQTEYADGHSDGPIAQVRSDYFNPGYDLVIVENPFQSFNALARWTRQESDSLNWSLQAQHNRVERVEFGAADLSWNMTDVDFGLHWRASEIHDFNFGLGARVLNDSVRTTSLIYFTPPSATDRWFSGYVQDDITLISDTLRLTIGAKLEDNNFTGFEIQPSAKLFFRPDPEFAIWGGVSRAIITPSRLWRDSHLTFSVALPGDPRNPSPLPAYAQVNGVPTARSETVYAYEAGLRADLAPSWSLDLAGYYNQYDRVTTPTFRSASPIFTDVVPFPVGVQLDIDLESRGTADTWGIEAVLEGEIAPWWKLEASYSHFNYSVPIDPATGQAFVFFQPLEGSPRHQARLHNSFDMDDRLSLDVDLRHVSDLSAGIVPAYTSADFRVAYRPAVELELSLIGEGLVHERRVEFIQPDYPVPTGYVSRRISLEIRRRF